MARGEIWTVEIPAPAGRARHEQLGIRPGIIVQADHADSKLPTTIVIPTTSNQEALRFPYTVAIQPSTRNGLEKPSILLIFQIRAIDKRRLLRKIGKLEDGYLNTLEIALRELLAI